MGERYMKNFKKGFSIVQTMLVLALSAGAFSVIAELLKQVNVVAIRGREGATLASLQDMFAPLRNRDKMPDVISNMRSGTSWFNSCLPNTGSTYSCPSSANVAPYPELQSKASGRYVFEADLVDLHGKTIAGTTSSPIYFDDTGSPCSGSDCRFESKGFAIIKNTSDPDEVTLVNVIIQNPLANKRGTVWKPRYTYLEIGTYWKTVADNKCLSGEYVSGLDSDHNVICTALPTPKLRKIYEQTFGFSATSGLALINDASFPSGVTTCALSATDDDTSMFQDSDDVSNKVLVSGGFKCEVRKSGTQWYGVAPMASGSVACQATCTVFEAYH